MIQMLGFGIHLTRDDPTGGHDFRRQRLFQLPSQIPGLSGQELACRCSLRFRKPLQKRKILIRQRYGDRAHERRLVTETVDFKDRGGAVVRIYAWGILKRGRARYRAKCLKNGLS